MALIFDNQQKFWHWENYTYIDGNFMAALYIDEHDPIWQRANPTQSRIDIFSADETKNCIAVDCRILDNRYSGEEEPVIYTQVGLMSVNRIKYSDIDENSPAEYQEAKRVVDDVEAWVTERYPNYSLFGKNNSLKANTIGTDIWGELSDISNDIIAQMGDGFRYELPAPRIREWATDESLRQKIIDLSKDKDFWKYYDRALAKKDAMLERYTMDDIFAC